MPKRTMALGHRASAFLAHCPRVTNYKSSRVIFAGSDIRSRPLRGWRAVQIIRHPAECQGFVDQRRRRLQVEVPCGDTHKFGIDHP